MIERSTHTAAPQRRVRLAVLLFACAASCVAGWVARGPGSDPAPPAAVKERAAASHAVAPAPQRRAAPLVAVAGDGNVTLHVDQQPLQWVLEQIAAQAGWPELLAPARARTAGTGASKAAAVPAGALAPAAKPAAAASAPHDEAGSACTWPAPRPVDAARVTHALASPHENERFDGLMLARSGGVPVPEHTLKLLIDADPSEHVRMAAFETHLEQFADRPDALRAALDAAQYAASPAIQREARTRLATLHEFERLAAPPLPGDP
jgi:hypothetical protein